MRHLAILLLVVTGSACAAPPPVKAPEQAPVAPRQAIAGDLILLDRNHVFWVVAEDAAGNPIWVKAPQQYAHVIVLGGPPTPLPPPPGPLPPPVPLLTQRAIDIRDAALKATADHNRAATASDLSAAYSSIAALIHSGSLAGSNISSAVTSQTDAAIQKRQAPPVAWQPMRKVLADQWNALLQEGRPDVAFATLLEEARDGLREAAK